MSRRYLETIKVIDGELQHLSYHQERLDKTLGHSNRHNLLKLLHPPKSDIYRCRVLYDADSFFVEYSEYKKREIKSLKVVFDATIEYSKKYEDRENIERLFKKRETCDDILIVKDGLLCDTSVANIAFFDGEVWQTPKTPLLFGTTRARLLHSKKIVPKDIILEEIKSYKKVALMNAMIDFDIIAEENIGEIIC